MFSLADEWWKNYDNPIAPPDYWRRAPAPDDHLTDDDDPEERFGIVDSERAPKPAYHAVRAMFAMAGPGGAPGAPARSDDEITLREAARWGIPTLFVALALGAAVWMRARAAREE